MTLRDYKTDDAPILSQMLSEEGMEAGEMRFGAEGFRTFVLEGEGGAVGFFTLMPLRRVWYLQHFCVNRKHRGQGLAWILIKNLKSVVLSFGCPILLVGIPKGEGKKYLKAVFEHHPTIKAYEEDEKNFYYSILLENFSKEPGGLRHIERRQLSNHE